MKEVKTIPVSAALDMDRQMSELQAENVALMAENTAIKKERDQDFCIIAVIFVAVIAVLAHAMEISANGSKFSAMNSQPQSTVTKG